jgi:hypothetical protein
MDTIDDLRKKQRQEEQDFINSCPHEKLGDWTTVHSKPIVLREHSGSSYESKPDIQVKRCLRCNIIIKQQELVEVWQEIKI